MAYSPPSLFPPHFHATCQGKWPQSFPSFDWENGDLMSVVNQGREDWEGKHCYCGSLYIILLEYINYMNDGFILTFSYTRVHNGLSSCRSCLPLFSHCSLVLPKWSPLFSYLSFKSRFCLWQQTLTGLERSFSYIHRWYGVVFHLEATCPDSRAPPQASSWRLTHYKDAHCSLSCALCMWAMWKTRDLSALLTPFLMTLSTQ